MDLREAMRKRKSVRTYINKSVPENLLTRLINIFNTSDRLNTLKLRLMKMESSLIEHAMTGLIGNYGRIKNAPIWVIGISEEGKNYKENFGFAMERFILECTREGLGTCWVGGFFKVSLLEDTVSKDENEQIVCISPVGYAAPRRLGERSMRTLGRLDTRKPLNDRVFTEKWGNPATDLLSLNEDLLDIFESARWAPSASNLQPCHYIIDSEAIVISVKTSLRQKYPKILDKDKGMNFDFQGIDAGIGMAHIYLASKEYGINGEWRFEFNEPAIRDKYNIPNDARIVGVFDFQDK